MAARFSSLFFFYHSFPRLPFSFSLPPFSFFFTTHRDEPKTGSGNLQQEACSLENTHEWPTITAKAAGNGKRGGLVMVMDVVGDNFWESSRGHDETNEYETE